MFLPLILIIDKFTLILKLATHKYIIKMGSTEHKLTMLYHILCYVHTYYV